MTELGVMAIIGTLFGFTGIFGILVILACLMTINHRRLTNMMFKIACMMILVGFGGFATMVLVSILA